MQREDLELELQSIKQKMQMVECGNDEIKRYNHFQKMRLRARFSFIYNKSAV